MIKLTDILKAKNEFEKKYALRADTIYIMPDTYNLCSHYILSLTMIPGCDIIYGMTVIVKDFSKLDFTGKYYWGGNILILSEKEESLFYKGNSKSMDKITISDIKNKITEYKKNHSQPPSHVYLSDKAIKDIYGYDVNASWNVNKPILPLGHIYGMEVKSLSQNPELISSPLSHIELAIDCFKPTFNEEKLWEDFDKKCQGDLMLQCSCVNSKSPKISNNELHAPWIYDCHICDEPVYTTGALLAGCDKHICAACWGRKLFTSNEREDSHNNAVVKTNSCPECHGTGAYRGLNTVEPCRICGGKR